MIFKLQNDGVIRDVAPDGVMNFDCKASIVPTELEDPDNLKICIDLKNYIKDYQFEQHQNFEISIIVKPV